MPPAKREPIPLSKRLIDRFLFIPFFILGTLFTLVVNVAQIGIIASKPNPYWRTKVFAHYIRWYRNTLDPRLIILRSPFCQSTLWWDIFLFRPFHLLALYALFAGKDWIRIPSIIYASVVITITTNFLVGEIYEQFLSYLADDTWAIFFLNIPWILVPLILLYRMITGGEHPMTREATGKKVL
jgi:hypothetical protein